MSKRLATSQQVPPTGDGIEIMSVVDTMLKQMAIDSRLWKQGVVRADQLEYLREDLQERYQMGLKKYGTPLRARNGRRAIVDLYQEIQDAIMYSAQGRVEGDGAAGAYLELLINLGQQIAGELERRS